MGHQDVESRVEAERFRRFSKRLLRDLQGLEQMLERGMIESGVHRIGAEQEVFLVDPTWRPAPVAPELLATLERSRYTPEIGRFNAEINLEPLLLGARCFQRLEDDLAGHLEHLRRRARDLGVEVVLAGILPTIASSDLGLDNLAPYPRYAALSEAVRRLRGEDAGFRIEGTDELVIKGHTVMHESCNTSFQVHLQVGADELPAFYNAAQAVAGPLLAAATNSPLLFGRRLWSETRIALFEQAADTRSVGYEPQDRAPRVFFGRSWVRDAVELFRDDIARYRVLLATHADEDPFEKLGRGEAPDLTALRVHTSTVYRWNRACYGLTDGRPHLRIENRVLPAGPTVLDEVANAAFWVGLLFGVTRRLPDLTERLAFEDAKANFFAAARLGLSAHLRWVDGEELSATELVRARLLPLAREGLLSQGVASEDVDRYLGVIDARVASGRTGSEWMIESQAAMKKRGTQGEQMGALTAAMVARQREGRPGHEWALAELEEAGGVLRNHLRVEQFMTSDIVTVHHDEVIDLAAKLMEWRRVTHVPVEDDAGRLVGVVSPRSLLRMLEAGVRLEDGAVPVRSIMDVDLVSVTPETSTREAVKQMREAGVDCLLVVSDGRLVGMVREADFVELVSRMLDVA